MAAVRLSGAAFMIRSFPYWTIPKLNTTNFRVSRRILKKSFVLAGLAIAKKEKVDCLLAIGGGSVLDVAKSIAVGYYYDGDPFDFNLGKAKPSKALPVGSILTIASAGSESSDSCVISDPATKIKRGFNNPINRPLFAIEDPELTYTVSPYQTAVGVTDIMMHSLERYFNASDHYQLADDWALSLCKKRDDCW
jgi:alcohol dehydrogenase YqhD (iron-dependent ADH family)